MSPYMCERCYYPICSHLLSFGVGNGSVSWETFTRPLSRSPKENEATGGNDLTPPVTSSTADAPSAARTVSNHHSSLTPSLSHLILREPPPSPTPPADGRPDSRRGQRVVSSGLLNPGSSQTLQRRLLRNTCERTPWGSSWLSRTLWSRDLEHGCSQMWTEGWEQRLTGVQTAKE